MKKIKILTIVGTRPEIIRLSRVISKLDSSVNHVLVHTGQNYDYELNEIFFKDLELRNPKYYLDAAGKNASETIGKTIIETDKVLAKEKPDAVLVLGDTNSCLSAICAKRRKIPIFHMEAGNRCFDERVPEEINRKLVDSIADVNLTYSSIAREYLVKENFPIDRIIKTGSPMFEVLNYFSNKIEESNIHEKLKLRKNNYFLVSSHREENVDNEKKLLILAKSLNDIAKKYKKEIIVSTHPRTKRALKKLNFKFPSLVKFLKPLGFHDYNSLQKNALVVLSDSGTIYEEASILDFRALNIRDAHERPEAFEESPVLMTGICQERILQGIEYLAKEKRGKERKYCLVSDYSKPNVSDKVCNIIFSYIDYVNRAVWKKYS